jgi:hypothetical protein
MSYLTPVCFPNFCFQSSCTATPLFALSHKSSGRARDRLDADCGLMAS